MSLKELHELISIVLKHYCKVRAKTLARVCGKIIAMSPALGNVTQIMSRCMFSAFNEKYDWKQSLNLSFNQIAQVSFYFGKNIFSKWDKNHYFLSLLFTICLLTQAILLQQALLKIRTWLCINPDFFLKLVRVPLGEKSKL